MSENKKLPAHELAEYLYDRNVSNLAEGMARVYGKAQALSFLAMMGEDVQNFWTLIAQLLIQHAEQWENNNGCCCVLSQDGQDFLHALPRARSGIKLTIAELAE